jgi:hypothetical protein
MFIGDEATIYKPGAGKFTISGNNANYRGSFIQTVGTTTVNGAYFGGTSSIATSVLELADGSMVPPSSVVNLFNTGTINITSASGLEFAGQVVTGAGDTYINKTSTGTLRLTTTPKSGFIGTYTQSAGKTMLRKPTLEE